MAAMNDVYVDYDAGVDSAGKGTGYGTSAYATLEYALSDTTPDAEGDIFHIRSTGAIAVPSARYTLVASYGAPTEDQPVAFRGYSSVINDGGRPTFEGSTNSAAGFFSTAGNDFISISDMIFDQFTSHALDIDNSNVVINCKFTANPQAIRCDVYNTFINNEISGCTGTRAVELGGANMFRGNWIISDSADTLTTMLFLSSLGDCVVDNIFTVTGANAVDAITVSGGGNYVIGNTIDGGGSAIGAGILFDAATHEACVVQNNIITNFNGTGGTGIDFGSATSPISVYSHNAFWNNNAHVNNSGDEAKFQNPSTTPDNESLTGDPFARSDDNTFANRFVYWAPKNEGNVLGGAYPTS